MQVAVRARPAIAGRALTARALRAPATAAREPAVVARVGARVATASMFVTVDTQRWAVREWASRSSSIRLSRGENLIGQVGSKSDLILHAGFSLMLARNGLNQNISRSDLNAGSRPDLFGFTRSARDFLNVQPRGKEGACAGFFQHSPPRQRVNTKAGHHVEFPLQGLHLLPGLPLPCVSAPTRRRAPRTRAPRAPRFILLMARPLENHERTPPSRPVR